MTNSFTFNLPEIDIIQLLSKDKKTSEKMYNKIKMACTEVGVFSILNHGLPVKLINELYNVSKYFFSMPEDIKQEISMKKYSKCFRGYSPIFSEKADNKLNWYELVEFGLDLPNTDIRVKEGKPMHGPNLYPTNQQFKHTIDLYTNHLYKISNIIMSGISKSLGLDKNYFKRQFYNEPHWQFRCLHYPKRSVISIANINQSEVNEYNCGAHTDYGFFTIILYDKPGIEIELQNGDWKKVSIPKNNLVCFLGDTIEYWTNKLYKAAKHRVYVDPSKERYSFPFFFQPNYETIIKPFNLFSKKPQYTGNNFQYGPYSYSKYKSIYE